MRIAWKKVAITMTAIGAVLFALGWLAGCASMSPCFYEGKAVGRRDAETMKSLGMNVQCE